MKITGVRWDESRNRRENGGMVKVIGKEKATQKLVEEMGLNFRITRQGGVIMNVETGDNDALRDGQDFVHQCYRDRSVSINPIIDWTDDDVWSFLHHYGCEGNPLYQCGMHRIGCVGCPLASKKAQRKSLLLYPKYKANYIAAFDRMLERRKQLGRTSYTWQSGNDVMKWWTCDERMQDQYTMFDDEELFDILSELR